jgi:hypothetical protein
MIGTTKCGCGRHLLSPGVEGTEIGGVMHRRGQPCFMADADVHYEYDEDGAPYVVRHVKLDGAAS